MGYVYSWGPRVPRMDWSSAMKAISYPFTLDAKGKVNYTESTSKIYLDRVLTLLSTNINQRPILQEYGTDIGTALFENDNSITTATSSAIREAMKNWLPEVTINNITVFEPDDEGIANINIDLIFPNQVSSTLNITTAIFSYDGMVTK